MKVFVMRGLPGSGKSSWIKTQIARMESQAPNVVISADSYHLETVDGKSVYKFRPERARAAHDCCLSEFVRTMSLPSAIEVFVDNTNLSAWEIAPYVRVAEAFGWGCRDRALRVQRVHLDRPQRPRGASGDDLCHVAPGR